MAKFVLLYALNKAIECLVPESNSWNAVGRSDAALYTHSFVVL